MFGIDAVELMVVREPLVGIDDVVAAAVDDRSVVVDIDFDLRRMPARFEMVVAIVDYTVVERIPTELVSMIERATNCLDFERERELEPELYYQQRYHR